MKNTPGCESYYSTLTNYAKSTYGDTLIIGNPGTSTIQSYVGTVDNIIIYESQGLPSISTLQSRTFGLAKSGFCFDAYGVGTLDPTYAAQASQYVGCMQITDDSGSNPYDTLPSYLSSEIAALDTGSSSALPSISLNPTTGPAGSTIAVSGNTFLSNSAVTVSYDGAAVTTNPGTITTDSSGSFTATFTEPAPATGSHTVIAKDAASGLASAQFTVTSTTTTLSLTVNSVDLSGNSFTGQWVQLNDSSGNTIATGFTPATFSVTSGSQYTVFAANFQNVVFNHWSDGNTNPSRAITPTQSTTLTAYYSTSSTTTPPPSPTPPGSPTGLTATTVSTSQINLSWTAPTNNGGSTITGYKIERSTDGRSTWNIILASTANSWYSDYFLSASTTYTYRVSTINAIGTSSPSSTASATTSPATVPDQPRYLNATIASPSQINLSWWKPVNSGGSAITGYKIERSTDGGTTWNTIVANTGIAQYINYYSNTGLLSSTTYTYRISTINAIGTSLPSSTASATTSPATTLPSISLNPTTGPAGSTIAVSGNSFLSNSAVTVSYDTAAVTTNPGAITTDSSGSFTATFTEPAPSTGSHTVIAKDAASGLASAQFTVTSTTPPTTPPTTISLTVNSVDLSGNSFTGQWVQLNDSSGNTIATGFTPATFSVTSGSQYTVFAANFQNVVFNHWSDGNTNPSRAITPTQSTTLTAYYSTSSTTTPPPSPTSPSSPTGLAATATSTSQINLSWTAPIVDGGSPVTGYEIDRSTDGGISWFTIISNTATTATTYSDTGLASATQYTYRVSAINSAGTGSPSNTGSATTLTQTLPSDDTFSLVSVSKAVRSQTCQLTGSKGWICSITTTYVQPPLLGSATVYLEQGGSETSLGSITNSGTINNIPRDVDIKIIVSGGFQPITKLIHTPVSQTNYVYTCTVDGCNFTPDSSSNTATPAPTPPGSPTGLTATTVSSSQIDLSWTAPSGTISGYAIERSTSGGSFSTIVSNTATTATTYSDTGLASATQYTYRVSAINSAGTGSPSNTGSATTLTQTLPSDDTFSLVSVSKAVRSQTCQLTGSKGWICSITTTYVQPPLLGSATVYLEQGGSETSLGSITNSGTINNIPRDVDIKIIVSGGFQPITKLIHTPVSQTNYVYTCTVDGCNFTP